MPSRLHQTLFNVPGQDTISNNVVLLRFNCLGRWNKGSQCNGVVTLPSIHTQRPFSISSCNLLKYTNNLSASSTFSGQTNVIILDKAISLDPTSPNSIVGRAIVVHEVTETIFSMPLIVFGQSCPILSYLSFDPKMFLRKCNLYRLCNVGKTTDVK